VNGKSAVSNGFTICSGDQSVLVTASSAAEKTKWIEDLRAAILASRGWGGGEGGGGERNMDMAVLYPSLKSNSEHSELS